MNMIWGFYDAVTSLLSEEERRHESVAPENPPPEPKTYQDPWRKLTFDDNRHLTFVRNYQPVKQGQHIRVLLIGPPGCGKSSFINSVDSALRGKITTRALTATAYDSSFTSKFKTYKIPKEQPGTFYPFLLHDTMGIEQGTQGGANIQDIKLIISGNVKDGYVFNPTRSLSESDPSYNKKPIMSAKMSALVCLIPANTLTNEKLAKKLRDIREAASEFDIPQIVVLTKIDEACPEVKADIKNVYKSKYIKQRMEEVSIALGVSMNCIFPVKNYCEEIETDDVTDTLILSAMRKIIDYGEDFLNDTQPGRWCSIS